MLSADGDLNLKKYTPAENVLFCLKHTALCYPMLFVWCALAIVANIALPLISAYLPKAVISAITDNGDIAYLITVTLAFTLSIALISGVKRFTEQYVYRRRFIMNAYYLRKVANMGLRADYPNQENERFRKLQAESFSCCNSNFSPLTRVYDILIALISGILGFIIYFGILAELSIVIVLFIVGTTVISYFLNSYIVGWSQKHGGERIAYIQRTDYINRVSGDLRSAKDIRLYNMAVWLERLYGMNLAGLSDWYKRYTKIVFGVSVADSGLSLMREAAAYAYLIYLVLAARIDVADFVLYFGVITGFSTWLGSTLSQINALNGVNLSIVYLRNYLEYPQSFKTKGGISVNANSREPKTIELKNVCYRYEGAGEYALNNINMTLNPSEHLAVVGLNGAGKTTLVKLICGLTDPTEGEVLYDGVNVKDYDRTEYYRLFSAVFQQYSLMPVTIECIVSEAPEERTERERARECLKKAGLSAKIESLPKGVLSEFGKTVYDDGVEFSGGEIQKLLLARALYKDAPLMILDEPTAALDPIAESALYEAYDDIMRDKSAVFISHRLASTRFCDRIMLLDKGEIVEEGTHASLLALKGRYYELFETQAKYYREQPAQEVRAL